MRTLWQDLRYGLRMIWKTPGFSAIAILSLALGIGANTALFSVIDAMLLRKLPVKEPERLVLFKSVSNDNFGTGSYTGSSNRDKVTNQMLRTSFPYVAFTRFREQESGLSEVFAFGGGSLNVNANGQADVVSGQAVSGNYYTGLALYWVGQARKYRGPDNRGQNGGGQQNPVRQSLIDKATNDVQALQDGYDYDQPTVLRGPQHPVLAPYLWSSIGKS